MTLRAETVERSADANEPAKTPCVRERSWIEELLSQHEVRELASDRCGAIAGTGVRVRAQEHHVVTILRVHAQKTAVIAAHHHASPGAELFRRCRREDLCAAHGGEELVKVLGRRDHAAAAHDQPGCASPVFGRVDFTPAPGVIADRDLAIVY